MCIICFGNSSQGFSKLVKTVGLWWTPPKLVSLILLPHLIHDVDLSISFEANI